MKNKELINELCNLLKQFEKRDGNPSCDKYIAVIFGTLKEALKRLPNHPPQKFFSQREKDIFTEVEQTIRHIIEKITIEGDGLASEMHGAQNFSDDEYKRVNAFAHKNDLKSVLLRMLELLYLEHPELNAELNSVSQLR